MVSNGESEERAEDVISEEGSSSNSKLPLFLIVIVTIEIILIKKGVFSKLEKVTMAETEENK